MGSVLIKAQIKRAMRRPLIRGTDMGNRNLDYLAAEIHIRIVGPRGDDQ